MNHLLIAFSLLAAVCLYPGGLTLVAAAAGARLGFLPFGGGQASGRFRGLAGPYPLVTLVAAVLVVLTLPWPGNPLAQLLPLGLASSPVGGVPVTIAGLLWLRPLAEGEGGTRPAILYPGFLGILLLTLALALHSPGWVGVVGARGAGAEVGRVIVGVIGLASLPLWGGSPARPRGGLTWAPVIALCLFLIIPGVAGWPVPVALGLWLAASALAGVLAGLGGRALGSGQLAGLAASAGRIWIP
ncbi:MAG: hypothetical protein WBU92_03830 [Candidatus Dormiibacterota bacterium]